MQSLQRAMWADGGSAALRIDSPGGLAAQAECEDGLALPCAAGQTKPPLFEAQSLATRGARHPLLGACTDTRAAAPTSATTFRIATMRAFGSTLLIRERRQRQLRDPG